jgi:CBS-domain-containing membrane protein
MASQAATPITVLLHPDGSFVVDGKRNVASTTSRHFLQSLQGKDVEAAPKSFELQPTPADLRQQQIKQTSEPASPPGYFKRFLGKGASAPPRPSLKFVALSVLGSFIGITSLVLLELMSKSVSKSLDHVQLPMLIGSFGAQAVLIHGAPAAPFAQPWSAIGGNVISATCGVVSWTILGSPLGGNLGLVLSSAVAVSMAIGCMLLTKSVHPPAGATALIFTTAGKNMHDLGFIYVIFPVLVGSCVHCFIAMVLNNMADASRHYPAYWRSDNGETSKKQVQQTEKNLQKLPLTSAQPAASPLMGA